LRSVGITPGALETDIATGEEIGRHGTSCGRAPEVPGLWSCLPAAPQQVRPCCINSNMILTNFGKKNLKHIRMLHKITASLKLATLRKTRLTLRQLNKLSKMNDVRAYEYKEKLKLVRQQYAPPPHRLYNF
jgi:hypothetical protein